MIEGAVVLSIRGDINVGGKTYLCCFLFFFLKIDRSLALQFTKLSYLNHAIYLDKKITSIRPNLRALRDTHVV